MQAEEALFKMSPQQGRLWELSKSKNQTCAHLCMTIDGDLDKQRFQEAFESLAFLHEILATNYKSVSYLDEPLQYIAEDAPQLILLNDPAQMPETRLACQQAVIDNLAEGPITQAILLTESFNKHQLEIFLPALAVDHASLQQLFNDLAGLYNGTIQLPDEDEEEAEEEGDEPLQYVDFCQVQEDFYEEEHAAQGFSYWQEQQETLTFPMLQNRGPAGTSLQSHSMHLTPAQQEAFSQLCQHTKQDPETLGTALWLLTLWGRSHQRQGTVGLYFNNRKYEQLANGLGPYASYIPFPVQFVADYTIDDLLMQIQQRQQANHQWWEFFKPTDLSGKSYDIGFQYLKQPAAITHQGITFSHVAQTLISEPFKILLEITQQPQSSMPSLLILRFQTGVVTTKEAQFFLESFLECLTQLASQPQIPLQQLHLLGASEIAHLQTITKAPIPAQREGQTIVSTFEIQVQKHPHQIAVVDGTQKLSFQELDRRANQLAHRLLSLDVQRDQIIPLCADNNANALIGVLGILKAGAAYMPIDPAQPKARLELMLEPISRMLVLTTSDLQQHFNAASHPVIVIDDADHASLPTTSPDIHHHPEQAAYVIYTSGSTGKPKGSLITHRNVINLHHALKTTLYAELDTPQIISVNSPLAFDSSVKQVIQILDGHTLCMVPGQIRTDNQALMDFLQQHSVQIINGTPSQMSLLLDTAIQQQRTLPGTHILFGGEAVSNTLWQRSQNTASHRFYNLYGPTECTVNATCHLIDNSTDAPVIGSPLPGVCTYVIDRQNRQMPIDVPGELCIGGRGVSRGYLANPAQTAAVFVPDPFSSLPGARMYRTGDKACWTAQDTIAFHGRLDFQVKLRGFRIELAEIETILNSHPDIVENVVVLREDRPGIQQLVAYFRTQRAQQVKISDEDQATYTSFLQAHLPEYMVPSLFIAIDHMPLNRNGKVDRQALPNPQIILEQQQASQVAPRTQTERELKTLWQQVMELDEIGITQNFFQLGGHSLLAVRLMNQVHGHFQIELSLRTLFDNPTIEQFAIAVDQVIDQQHQGPKNHPQPVPRDGYLPLSFAQQRLWFIDQLEPGQALYNMPFAIKLNGQLDTAALEQAFQLLVDRHETLRTHFPAKDGKPYQKIQPSMAIKLPVLAMADESKAKAYVADFIQEPFDLSNGPLLRLALLQLSPSQHVLVLCLHHIVGDFVSMDILANEVASHYRTLHSGHSEPLEPLPFQYADFAVWQRNWLDETELERQLAYWRTQLAEIPSQLELPYDFPRPSQPNHHGQTLHFELPISLSNGLRQLAKQHDTTLNLTLLTLFKHYLSRLANSNDIAVGIPSAGRHHRDSDQLIGFLVNTLVIRAQCHNHAGFSDLLDQVRNNMLAALEHQDVPFEKLVEELKPERQTNVTPFFQVMFQFQETGQDEELSLPNLELASFSAGDDAAKFDLQVSLSDRGQNITGSFNFPTQLFERETIQALINHFKTLLEQAVANPQQPLTQLALLPDQTDRQAILSLGRANHWRQPATQTVNSMFDAQVQQTPDEEAIRIDDQAYTYAQLYSRANVIARGLVAQGLKPQTRIGLVAKRSLDLYAAIFGILKARCVFVPLSHDLPSHRLAQIVRDSDLAATLVLDPTTLQVPRPITLDELADSQLALPEANPKDMAYIMFTSGSTGTPKGVCSTHEGIVRLAFEPNYIHQLKPLRMMQIAPLSFDASTLEIFVTLLNGGTLYPHTGPTEVASIGQSMVQHKISHLWITTGLFNLMVSEYPESFAHVKEVVTGGEVMSLKRVREISKRYPQMRLNNVYGPTEATTFTTYFPIQAQDLDAPRMPIGRAINATEVYVLDHNLQLQPPPLRGELYIGGRGLAQGYSNRPDLTAERFLPNPFSQQPGERMYRSGDWAYMQADGNIQFIGRRDNQVKIRGFRIEIGEIEAQLKKTTQVRDAIVIVWEKGEHKYLVAYVQPTDPSAFVQTQLERHLQQSLPDYMMPSFYHILDQFPLNANGKVDRKALPHPQQAASQKVQSTKMSPDESLLAQIWLALLPVENVHLDDDFFELGGHSLLAAQLVSRIRQSFQVEIPLRALFENPRLADLAKALRQLKATDQNHLLPAIKPVTLDQRLPLSFAQQRLWFLDQLEPGNPSYNVVTSFQFKGTLNQDALAKAFEAIWQRHHILRTSYPSQDGQPYQYVHQDNPSPLQILDVSCNQDPVAEAHWYVKQVAEQHFNLQTGPVSNVQLLILDEDHHVLVINIHHIAIDGWSMGVLFGELAQAYQAFSQNQSLALQPLPIQYADYAVWQRTYQSEIIEKHQLNYWLTKLQGEITPLDLPKDFPRPDHFTYKGDDLNFSLTQEQSHALQQLAQQTQTTPFMVLLTIFKILLFRYTQQTDFCIGTPIAGRTQLETEPLIGLFVNTLVLRDQLQSQTSFQKNLHMVRETTLEAFAHQDLPFERLVEAVQPERDPSHPPLFQVMFAYQGFADNDQQLPNLEVTHFGDSSETAKFELMLSTFEQQGIIHGSFNFNTALFKRETIAAMAQHFVTLTQDALANSEQPIAALPLLTSSQRQQMLALGTSAKVDYPNGTNMVALFQTIAEQYRDKQAIRMGEQALTYAQLNRRANALAQVLKSQNLQPGDVAAIALPRSFEQIISILAILKCGAAYIPLDSQMPGERLQQLLEDSQARLIISSAQQPEISLPVIDPNQNQSEADNLPLNACFPESPAYIMFTSGSTGVPKGVTVVHRNIIHLVRNTNFATFDDTQVTLQLAPAAFDAATVEIWGALLNGGTLVLFDGDTSSTRAIAACIERHNITYAFFTAGLFHLMVEEQPQALAQIKQLMPGGDVVSPSHVRRLLEINPDQYICNGYGPTESTTFTTYQPFNIDHTASALPIGKPVANTDVYVLDGNGQLAPVGVHGELFIGGDGLAQGYANRPDLTAERFLPNPFAATLGERMYRTGDRVRWRQDHALDFVGRLDQQIKLRGFRIELEEIQRALVDHPQIANAFVTITGEGAGDKQIAAYLVWHSEALDQADLRDFLAHKLPAYMIPSFFVTLDQLPLNANKKVDRKALPDPRLQRAKRPPQRPQNAAEAQLSQLWQQVLQVDYVGRHDNFFEIGGHSLAAVRLNNSIRQTFGVELPMRAFFEQPTVAQQIRYIQQLRHQDLAVPAIQPSEPAEHYPLSFAQERLWFLDQMDPGDPTYNVPLVQRIRGPLDQNALKLSLKALIQRHPMLRTIFIEQAGQPTQQVLTEADVELTCQHVEDLDQATLQNVIQERTAHRFNLSQNPPWFAQLLVCGPEDHILILNFHHILIDGWSLQRFLSEWIEGYHLAQHGTVLPETPAPLNYSDFALWQRQQLEQVLQQQLTYWQDQLANVPPVLELTTDRPRPKLQSYAGDRHSFSLPNQLVQELRSFAANDQQTAYMVCLAAFKLLLARQSGQADFCVGTPISGRHHAQTQHMLGLFVNTLAIRNPVDEYLNFRQLAQSVRRTVLDAFQHQDVPFEKLLDALKLDRNPSYSPLFQVMFDLASTREEDRQLQDSQLQFGAVDYNNPTAKFDLTLTMVDNGEHIHGAFEYATALFDASSIEQLAEDLIELLTQVLQNPDQPLYQHELQSQASTLTNYEPKLLFHQQFEHLAAEQPEKTALVDPTSSLSYQALNSQANRLARALRKQQLPDEATIAVAVSRNADWIISLLAILKAGYAYLPIDAKAPAKRTQSMLQQSDARLILQLTEAPEQVQVPCLDIPQLIEQQQDDSNLDLPVDPNQLAYTIFTSGSTGEPKGVQVSHLALAHFCQHASQQYGLNRDSNLLQFASPTFDTSLEEITLPLSQGGSLYLRDDSLLHAQMLLAACRQHQITVLDLPTAYWHELVRALDNDKLTLPNCIQTVIIGGEAANPEALQAWQETVGTQVALLNTYGPTETTIVASLANLADFQVSSENTSLPIGEALGMSQLYILDRYLRPVPNGTKGELWIGGPGLARGYANRPDLSAERFHPNPFSSTPGARMYRTGDRVSRNHSGQLTYHGRIDQQLKVRGYRIEPGEIAAAVKRLPGIAEAIVSARRVDGQNQLLCHIVVTKDQPVAIADLREALRKSLPDYMIPAFFIPIEQVPLTQNRKVNYAALPSPESQNLSGLRGTYVAPRDTLEWQLKDIYEAVLGLSPIGIHDNFFELGGHSLLAVQLNKRLEALLNQTIPLATQFNHQTIASIAGYLRRDQQEPETPQTLVSLRQAPDPQAVLYWVHPAGGQVFSYIGATRLIDAPVSHFAFQASGFNQQEQAENNLHGMAQNYAKQLLQQPSEQPIYLTGWSMGGCIAYEMAHDLLKQGRSVAGVIMIDSQAPQPHQRGVLSSESQLLHEWAQQLRIPNAVQHLDSEAPMDESLAQLLALARQQDLVPPEIELADVKRRFDLYLAHSQALANYQPQTLNVPVHLLHTPQFDTAALAQWQQLCNLQAIQTQGTHATLFETPNVEIIAQHLTNLLTH